MNNNLQIVKKITEVFFKQSHSRIYFFGIAIFKKYLKHTDNIFSKYKAGR